MNTRVGVDGRKIPESAKRGPLGSLHHAKELGLEGIFFRTVLDMSPTLDPGELRDIGQLASELDLYVETGLGKVNPFGSAEAPELREIGDGDIVLGFRRMMEACAAQGWRELWVATANYKPKFRGKYAYDRFRTDVDWSDQLRATEGFLKRLAPIARDLGIHMNLETHEEITSFEVIRLVEAVGTDVTGIVFDTANVLQRAEHPIHAAKRLAPYVRQTHIKDALLSFDGGGIEFQLRPCGDGVVDFRELLPILLRENPDLNLSIENAEYYENSEPPLYTMHIDIFDEGWLDGHPDLTVREFAQYIEMVKDYEQRITSGDQPTLGEYRARPYQFDDAIAYILRSAEHLRGIIDELEGQHLEPLAGVRR
ncbi:sugar phosphate isomerase/epimerase family protein [Paenarthrobacter nicotinovorans]|uniref:sugar phosphate isomerase/epimerase family protein n=1 Tax=Paenarthrobacter nicotinovorans TaxID=29320 RepID=UPI0037478346